MAPRKNTPKDTPAVKETPQSGVQVSDLLDSIDFTDMDIQVEDAKLLNVPVIVTGKELESDASKQPLDNPVVTLSQVKQVVNDAQAATLLPISGKLESLGEYMKSINAELLSQGEKQLQKIKACLPPFDTTSASLTAYEVTSIVKNVITVTTSALEAKIGKLEDRLADSEKALNACRLTILDFLDALNKQGVYTAQAAAPVAAPKVEEKLTRVERTSKPEVEVKEPGTQTEYTVTTARQEPPDVLTGQPERVDVAAQGQLGPRILEIIRKSTHRLSAKAWATCLYEKTKLQFAEITENDLFLWLHRKNIEGADGNLDPAKI